MPSSVPNYSVVIPANNEADNIGPLIGEICATLESQSFEIICVDDGSDDGTAETLGKLAKDIPELTFTRHAASAGQSSAIVSGVRQARAAVIITLDGDGQNDPADILALLARFNEAPDPDKILVTGLRAKRQDSFIKRLSSKVANAVRAAMLGDGTPDTGSGLKVFSRQAFLDMPRFDHMHRFLPALMQRQGGEVVSVPVNHRPRRHGTTKYGLFDRLGVGIVDLVGVMWLKRRPIKSKIKRDANGEAGGDGGA